MFTAFPRRLIAVAALMGAQGMAHAIATTTPAGTNVTFSGVASLSQSLTVNNSVGGTLTITPQGGSHITGLSGKVGVSQNSAADTTVGSGEGILFSFTKGVTLSRLLLDMPGTGGSFTLSVNGGGAQTYSVATFQNSVSIAGSTFLFGWSGTNYAINSATFGKATSPVPEADVVAMVLAGAGIAAFAARRQRRSKAA
ncbi:hypothetical protein EYS42_08280 [Aquabacterium lacunae]|uniref:PEP-CTERM sorting domain-containing protein n=1 Tax=Aquabacterium lacunae TaxID=2528630 RepID=A0A4Q9GYD2_9BURK|nr:hypothetical protein [Aquabacterium lacunae]TBO31235.1 hypothetical protein EYS42_08280 [Aquabacterium lacunae]